MEKEAKYFFAESINGTDETGIVNVSTNPPTLLCLCTKEKSKIILAGLVSHDENTEEKSLNRLYESQMKTILGKYTKEEISFGKMVELINETVGASERNKSIHEIDLESFYKQTKVLFSNFSAKHFDESDLFEAFKVAVKYYIVTQRKESE